MDVEKPLVTLATPRWQIVIAGALGINFLGGCLTCTVLAVLGSFQPQPSMDHVVYVVLSVVLLVAALLVGWMIVSNLERIELTRSGLSRHTVGHETSLAWHEIAGVRLRNWNGQMLITGQDDCVIRVSNSYTKFDEFLQEFRRHVDWDHLVRAALGADELSRVPFDAATGLPFVESRLRTVLSSLLLAIVFGGLTYLFWFAMRGNAGFLEHAKNLASRHGKLVVLAIFSPVGAVGSFLAALKTWHTVRIERDGLYLGALVRSRTLYWDAIESVGATLVTEQTHGSKSYRHKLQIRPREGSACTVPMGDRSFFLANLIVQAAAAEGVKLTRRDE